MTYPSSSHCQDDPRIESRILSIKHLNMPAIQSMLTWFRMPISATFLEIPGGAMDFFSRATERIQFQWKVVTPQFDQFG